MPASSSNTVWSLLHANIDVKRQWIRENPDQLSVLSERNRQVLEMLAGVGGQPQTLKATGRHFNISTKRVSDILRDGLRKIAMRSRQTPPSVLDSARLGAIGIQDPARRTLHSKSIFSVGSLCKRTSNELASKGLTELQIEDVRKCLSAVARSLAGEEGPEAILISELDLSVRPFNSLLRHGVYTLKNLQSLSEFERDKVHNMGVKSWAEVDRAIAQRLEDLKSTA
jgi:DNA-binding CsgD family transcriptional regulator